MDQTGPITEEVNFLSVDESVEANAPLAIFEEVIEEITPLVQVQLGLLEEGVLDSHEADITTRTPLNLHVGVVPYWINPFRVEVPMYQKQNYHKLFHRTPVYLREKLLHGIGPLMQSDFTTSGSDNLILIDVLGPQIFNTIPASGSSFNNPTSTVSFDLIDTGGADIALSGTQIYVDSVLVIDAGADVTPSGYGTTSFTAVDTNFYQFEFIPTDPFSPDAPITISGRSSDLTVSGNVEYFNYSFKVWKTQDLSASITGLPDTLPPFLINQDPFPGQVEVPVATDIFLRVDDLHTGVDLASVVIAVEDITVYSGQLSQSASYPVIRTETPEGRGFDFTIYPVSSFPFSDEISISVYAEDSFSTANILDTSYSFFTVTNAHLVASGLQIFDGGYVDMDIASSYTTTSSTPFHITYYNTLGTGLSLSGSSVLLDGIEVSSTITPVSGNPLAYDVYFELAPDYTDNALLTFHVQQSGTVSGTILDRNFTTELLWGYEFCHTGEELKHDADFDYFVRVRDRGDAPTLSALSKHFSTIPLDTHKLYASIAGINPPAQEISALYISNNTFFEYGKTMVMELEAEDFAGNKLLKQWSFTIEDE